ncbi:esterase [Agrobacterium sp. TS43]|uniref:alpha/beta hydrolase n=1 Tax=Agrobacterium TaxID=357 RepID=UPI0004A182AE|nr:MULTISPECIES: alpha/beta hydrolase [Agrobacterium]KDR86568.1 esterase [Agrobacterium tumefaciens GW4]KVK46733.1 esterase [Agrobacterium sp. LY4]KVK46820.1 esterase [Agrobacterium sp. JL28]KVK61141.1 esterase [Agrobacterium sp. TS45]KVK66271.1 esterase [Agrobacterium sp. C13]
MTYDSSAARKLRDEMFAFNVAHPVNTIETLRVGMEAISQLNPPAVDLIVETIELGGVAAEVITAPGASKDRVIYHFHGGGWVAGSPSSHLGMLGELSRAAKSQVIVLDHSKAPEHPFPASYDESIRGYEALRALGKPFAISGDSSGGGMALNLLAYASSKGHKDARAALLISPWADLTLTLPSLTQLAERDPMVNASAMREMVEAYVGNHDLKDPRISPLFADMHGFPPLLIHVGSDEILLDDAIEIDRKVRAAGGESHLEVWPEMLHVWHIQTATLPQAHDALQRAGEFLNGHLQK